VNHEVGVCGNGRNLCINDSPPYMFDVSTGVRTSPFGRHENLHNLPSHSVCVTGGRTHQLPHRPNIPFNQYVRFCIIIFADLYICRANAHQSVWLDLWIYRGIRDNVHLFISEI